MNQARSEEEEKERKRDRKDRGQEADGKKGSPTKNISEELKQSLPTKAQAKVNKERGAPNRYVSNRGGGGFVRDTSEQAIWLRTQGSQSTTGSRTAQGRG